MYDELTKVDMQKMREELRYREEKLMPKILEDIKVARSFGDLSENFEYKAAKTKQRKNMSRIRYLKQMIASAKERVALTPMHDELTKVDMQKMCEELRYCEEELMPMILESVKVARSFGSLSKNFEYKAAKTEQCKIVRRIRYLKQVIASAVVIDTDSEEDEVGLFDRVTLYPEDDEEEMEVRFVTTPRQNALEGLISKESPLGTAVLGHKVGERVYVQVNDDYGYYVQIRSVEKGEDDASLAFSYY